MLRSYRVIASVSSGPIPGTEKKRSTNNEPLMVNMNDDGRFCAIGTKALRKT